MKTKRLALKLVAVIAVMSSFPATAAPETATGGQAFAQQDFAAAATLWRKEAEAGSAEAKLGLGLIFDLGLGTENNPDEAFRWYLAAANAGLPNAQFNVGVMLDGGAGTGRDTGNAAIWYARAAANGHKRAQYNLGLLYELGDGVPQNLDLAQSWLRRAAEALPAAAARLEDLRPAYPEERVFGPPDVTVAAVTSTDATLQAEFVWTAPTGPAGSTFFFELAHLMDELDRFGPTIFTEETDASAIAIDLPAEDAAYAWRISLLDWNGERYSASKWRQFAVKDGQMVDQGELELFDGRVTFRVGAKDVNARQLAEELASSFLRGGLWVGIEETTETIRESSVRYTYADDALLAEGIAAFLPVLDGSDALRVRDRKAAPGEIIVSLSGGPDTAAAQILEE